MKANRHQPVLLEEAISSLNIQGDGIYLDGTFGRGGHSRALLAQLTEQGRLFALDKDPQAVMAGQELQAEDARFSIIQGSFADMSHWLHGWGLTGRLDGILLDLGVSSPQLDDPKRGFSFMGDGPLDMRMDPSQGIPASEWIAGATEREMSRVFWEYGEERHARRIARSIVMARERQSLTRTSQLAELIVDTVGKWERKHPATRCFQAIRIYINNELADLAEGLGSSIDELRPGGRLVAISFHSLEDRLVKRTFREAARPGQVRRNIPEHPDWKPRIKLMSKAIRSSEQEISVNPRARSAVMRVAEKLD